ncbi:hypothetical protein ACHAWC_011617 [Mediolabrus comicus]
MDADRVRSYLQVACAGLGFDIGEVWWMSNENGTSTVAAIEDRNTTCGDESDSSGEVCELTAENSMKQPSSSSSSSRKKKSKKRFLQLYTSKAYGNQRSKLVQPHHRNEDNNNDNGNNEDGFTNMQPTPPSSAAAASSSQQMIVKRRSSFGNEEDEEHVLSPRIVEAVTHSTQVVWANCQKTEGLLGRSDMKLQTAIGMPVGVDENGNVWVVVMFSPKNVESTSDAIDYLQYISRSAASTSIPCLLPVVGEPARGGKVNNNNMITNGEEVESTNNNDDDDDVQCHTLVSIKPQIKRPDTTQDLGEGVTAKFVSFNLNDDNDDMNKSSQQVITHGSSINALKDAPRDDLGMSVLPAPTELNGRGGGGSNSASSNTSQQILDAIDNAITDAFDEASYGVWSTIMNSAGGGTVPTADTIATKMYLIQERLEEFANAFLGMSVFDIADAWTVSSYSADGIAQNPVMKCLFTAAATESNPEINDFREFSANASIAPGDGAVGKAFSTGYPVWSSVKDLIYDTSRTKAFLNCSIETAFAVPIFSAGDVSPSCVLCCYSLLPAESVPFVLNFVQKAVRLLWDGLDKIVNPHESVGKELWKEVAPADLGEMAADLEMQKEFIGKKRPRSDSIQEQFHQDDSRDRNPYSATEHYVPVPINTPPMRGLSPAPLFPSTVQALSQNAQQFVYLDGDNDGHWAVQQAVRSVGDMNLWTDNNGANVSSVGGGTLSPDLVHQQQNHQDHPGHQMAFVDYANQASTGQVDQYQSIGTVDPIPVNNPYAGQGDDPDTIRANLFEINAMAQNYQAAVPPAANMNEDIQYQAQYQQIANIDQMHVVPLSQSEGSVILTGPQQNMFCTTTAQPLPVTSMNLSTNSDQKTCRIEGCNDLAVSKRPYCARHCGNRQCEREGCSKCAQGATRFCIAHGGGRRCTFPGCDKGARDKFFCAAHGGGKRCKREGCSKSAVGGSNFCTGHGGGKRCGVPGCDKSAQSSTKFCVKHGGGKKCQYEGCEKVSRGKTLFCAAHGGGVRCKLEGCNRVAIGKAQLCRAHGGGVNSRFSFM